jgi:hypothetical protein
MTCAGAALGKFPNAYLEPSYPGGNTSPCSSFKDCNASLSTA